MSTRPSRAECLVAAALCLAACGLAVPARAQSLADVAKKEEERRQKVGEPTKVYTNKDLKTPTGPMVPPPVQETPAPAGDAAKDNGDAPKAKTVEKDPTKDPDYWAARQKVLRTKLDQDQSFYDAMQSRINALTTDAVNRDDPIQRGKLERDRQKALADLARLAKAIEDDNKATAKFLEEARRAGIPPGWLR